MTYILSVLVPLLWLILMFGPMIWLDQRQGRREAACRASDIKCGKCPACCGYENTGL